MVVKFRNYKHTERFSKDYFSVVEFLERINDSNLTNANFLWGRWAWMISRPVDNEEDKKKIGLWLDNDNVVALATFELTFGKVHIMVDRAYRYLIKEIMDYTQAELSGKDGLQIIINDTDKRFQEYARAKNMRPSQRNQKTSIFNCSNELSYNLPDFYKIISMDQEWSWEQYNRVMWRGFNHEGEPSQSKEDLDWRKSMLSSPHLSKELCLAVCNAQGEYVSHCCLWHLPGSKVAYIEPVATDPLYRKKGLAKAALFEAINRVRRMGAEKIIVGSSQQFYYNIGFAPHTTETWWES